MSERRRHGEFAATKPHLFPEARCVRWPSIFSSAQHQHNQQQRPAPSCVLLAAVVGVTRLLPPPSIHGSSSGIVRVCTAAPPLPAPPAPLPVPRAHSPAPQSGLGRGHISLAIPLRAPARPHGAPPVGRLLVRHRDEAPEHSHAGACTGAGGTVGKTDRELGTKEREPAPASATRGSERGGARRGGAPRTAIQTMEMADGMRTA